jgi:hypothetical protein
VLIERADGTVARRLDFSGASVQTIGGTEAAVFAQDRLQPHQRWYVETGLRLDRDGVLGHVNLSPRIGTAVLLSESGHVMVRGGWGLFVERTPSMAGVFTSFETAVDTRFSTDAVSPGVPVTHSVAPLSRRRSAGRGMRPSTIAGTHAGRFMWVCCTERADTNRS